MPITAAQVNELRMRTGISMMQCKKALEEANGDEEKAIDILRKKGMAKASEKADRAMKEGVVLTKLQGNKATIVKLTCETDFVSKNEEFRAIAAKAADEALKHGAEAAMESQKAVIAELFAKLGENMALEVDVLEGEGIADYVHGNGKVGVLVRLKGGTAEHGRDVAMQVAAMKPHVIYPHEVSDDIVAKEKEIWRAQLTTEGKPADMHDRIMLGKEKKFREESALLKQTFVKDGSMTVEEYLSGATVEHFVRKAI